MTSKSSILLKRAAAILIPLLIGISWRLFTPSTPSDSGTKNSSHSTPSSSHRDASRSPENSAQPTRNPPNISAPIKELDPDQYLIRVPHSYIEKFNLIESAGSTEIQRQPLQSIGFSEQEITEIEALLQEMFEAQMKKSLARMKVLENTSERIRLSITGDPSATPPQREEVLAKLRAISGDTATIIAPSFLRQLAELTDDYGSRTQIIIIDTPPGEPRRNHSFWLADPIPDHTDIEAMDFPALKEIAHGYRQGIGEHLSPSAKYYFNKVQNR